MNERIDVLAQLQTTYCPPECLAAVAELIESDKEYDAALAAHKDLNRQIDEQGWIEVEFDALRKAGERFVVACIRRDRALSSVGGLA